MTAKLQPEYEEICDNRIITLAMGDEFWTRHIIEQCANDGNTERNTPIDSSEISVNGGLISGVEFSSDLYDEDELFDIKMSVINCSDFWESETMSSAEVQAKILFDSGYNYPDVKEALALVDFREVNHSLLATMSGKNTSQDSYNA